MQSTIDRYGAGIEDGTIDPTRDINKVSSGLVFDPNDDLTPLQVLGFGIYKLNGGTETAETAAREHVFVPMEGSFIIEVERQTFQMEREGGPFDIAIGESAASALYIPRDSSYRISGSGEIIYYTAPSSRKMKAVHVTRGEKSNVSRGELFWRRNVVTLVEPGVSTNLTIGETYSPPALWSGTPIHVHDVADESRGESEHEEVYYHRCRMIDREMPNYAVQLLFDGKIMNKAYLCPNRTAVAIPGGAHPVVASPVSDCIYSFGLAGEGAPLGMRDLDDFAYLKQVDPFLEQLHGESGGKAIIAAPRSKLDEFARKKGLDDYQTKITELIAAEWGITFS